MKKIIALLLVLVISLSFMTGCEPSKKVNAAIESNISTLDNKLSNLEVTVGDLYKEGVATEEMKEQVADLQDQLNDTKSMFEATVKGEQDQNISNKLVDITSKAEELESKVQDALGGVGNVGNYADMLKKSSADLEKSIKDSVEKGIMDNSKITEFENWMKKLNAISADPKETTENKAELIKIRDGLAALASEAGAGNNVIDSLGSSEKSSVQPTVPSKDVEGLVDAYTALQNSASQLVDKGGITEEQYANVLKLGVKVAELKEKAQKNANADEINKEVENLLNQVSEMAKEVK